jgi:hypothetical protein
MSALGQKRTSAPQKVCPLFTRKRTFAVHSAMSALGHKRTFEKRNQLRCHYSMYDFSSRIAAGEKFPSGVLGFKPFDPTILIGHLPMPECAKCVVH